MEIFAYPKIPKTKDYFCVMLIHSADFVASYTNVEKCPQPTKPEYAFIGRSNVGKSSLINMLVERKKLAKVSSTPGKTQTINHFIINEQWYLVDLPGYGYAKISKYQREKWTRFIRGYMKRRENLQCVFLLIDSRLKPQKNDLEFANWLGGIPVPFVIVYTKADKNKASELKKNTQTFEKAMLESWETMPQQFITSSEKKLGRDEILHFINDLNQSFYD